MDTHSKAQRSFNMSRIKSRDTTPEMIVRRLLFSMGYRYRVNAKELPGKPDIVFTRKRKAIFVHGCFWHRHSACRYTTMPKTNTDFWKNKISLSVCFFLFFFLVYPTLWKFGLVELKESVTRFTFYSMRR